MRRWVRVIGSTALYAASLGAMASQSYLHDGANTGFLPAEKAQGVLRGSAAIICGLPSSQNPVLGATSEQVRKQAVQRDAWSRLLNADRMPDAVKVDAPVPPGALTPGGTKD